MAIQII